MNINETLDNPFTLVRCNRLGERRRVGLQYLEELFGFHFARGTLSGHTANKKKFPVPGQKETVRAQLRRHPSRQRLTYDLSTGAFRVHPDRGQNKVFALFAL